MTDKRKVCCFSGHREIIGNKEDLKIKLKSELVKLIQNGVIYFGAGGARGFDSLAAETVIELREVYTQIRLVLILPCHNQTNGWNQKDIEIYENIKKKADKVVYLSAKYYDGCMHNRNRYMVSFSSVCVCYKRKPYGGTAYTVKFARQHNLKIIEL